MPTYTYTCTACNDVIEKRQSFSDPPLTTCEQCGGTLRKVIHPVGIVFKGSGWYITDSRSSSASAINGPGKSPESSSAQTSSESSDSSNASKESKPAATPSKDSAGSSTKPAKSSD